MRPFVIVMASVLFVLAPASAQKCNVYTTVTINGSNADVDLYIKSTSTSFVLGTCSFILQYDPAVIGSPQLVAENNGPWSDTDPDYLPLSSVDHPASGFVDVVIMFNGGGDLNGSEVTTAATRIGTLRFAVLNASEAASAQLTWRSIGIVTQILKQVNPGADMAYQEITDSCALHVVALRAFLQGPFAGGGMGTGLRAAGYIPRMQPYNVAPWSYVGSESVATVPADVVDWVLVELRSGTAANTKVAARAAFLKSDGAIVDLDGTSALGFPGLAPGPYYIVLRHRNHLGAMTSAPVLLSAVSAQYDLTTGLDRYYGGQAKALTDGVYGLFAGDVTGNGAIVLAQELTAVRANNLRQRYDPADVNMNGAVVLSQELTVVRGNNLQTTKVP
jgi:hypothetical protein